MLTRRADVSVWYALNERRELRLGSIDLQYWLNSAGEL
jgi:hypothetical protein